MATKVDINANIESKEKTGITGERSLKSLRTYQLGVVYKDKYGRETPVFTNEDATFTINKNVSDSKNSIVTSLNNDSPSWADSYKFFIKETSNEYYNACMDRWYDAEDENVWLSFPSAERNKIQEDTFLILKKPSDSNKAVYEESRYRVIDIQNEAPDFIKTDYELYGEQTLDINEANPSSKIIKIEMTANGDTTDWDNSVFFDAVVADADSIGSESGFIGWPLENVVINLSPTGGGSSTGWLDVANIQLFDANNIHITLSKPLKGSAAGTNIDSAGGILAVLPIGAGDAVVKIAKKVVKNKPEFDGRFFVKIRKDAVVEEHVRSVGNPMPSFNVVSSIQQYYINKSQSSGTNYTTYWEDVGQRWFIDDAERDAVGTGGGTGTKGPYPEDDGYGIKGNGTGSRSGSAKSSLRCTMELSLNKVKDTNKAGFDISNNSQANQDFISKMSSDGTLFRWKEDPWQHIYRVVKTHSSLDGGTNGDGIYNYGSKNSQKKEKSNKTARLYIKFKTTGYRLNADGTGTYIHVPEEEGLYPFNYQNEYTPQAVTSVIWNPTMYGYGDYNDPSNATPNYNGPSGASFGDILGNGQTGSSFNESSTTTGDVHSNTIQIIETGTGDEEPTVPKNPAIWETEPKEDIGLDIYYEASQAYPTNLNNKTNELFAPYGCVVTATDKKVIGPLELSIYIPEDTVLYDWTPTGHGGDTILLNIKTDEIGFVQQQLVGPAGTISAPQTFLGNFMGLQNLLGTELRFTKVDGSYTTAKISHISGWSSTNLFINPSGYTGNSTDRVLIKLDRDLSKMNIKLPYFNCYSFGNGVESDRIRDDFNAVRLDKGVKASTVLDEPYEEEQRTNGLIYSGIYNSTNGINNLNQFIAAEKITKDVNPSYGSIQKLKTRDTDLITFCEDKVLKIVANKDALYNADGKPQLISTNNVLGNTTTFAGEFGISRNPESFAEEAFRIYFTDKQRGKVLRLSGNGITDISKVGMKDYFADNLKLYDNLIGSFDDRKEEYNLTLKTKDFTKNTTISFSEEAKGWTSFKSFIQDNGLSLNNDYYTLKNGELWKHHSNEIRNNFYGNQYNSHVDVLFNEESATVKSFGSMKYEGSQAKITQNLGYTDANGVFYPDNEYYNNIGKSGWYVESGETDLQLAGEMEFKNKEGKWFSYMKGVPVESVEDLNSKEFSFQGIDILDSINTVNVIQGCMDPNALNYDPTAIVDDGSCSYLSGCTDPTAVNYDQNATQDDGSCVICSTLRINYTVANHLMSNLSNGIKVVLENTGDDLPYTVACLDNQGTVIGDTGSSIMSSGWSSGGTTSQGDIVYFGQVVPLPTGTYTIVITTAHGCTDQNTISVDNGVTPPPPVPPIVIPPTPAVLAIGDTHQGGIIFYLDGSGGGLIAMSQDQSPGAAWCGSHSTISGADGIAIGTGNQNTIDIIAGCSTSGTAAEICANLVGGVSPGYSDWYLPSKDELNEMYLNIGQGNALGLGNIGNFSGYNYWSSTEFDSLRAWKQWFFDPIQYPSGIGAGKTNKQSYQIRVRAIRAF